MKQIMEKLEKIESELDFIKEHMIDVDSILTKEEANILESGLKEYKEGKTISFEKIKKRRR